MIGLSSGRVLAESARRVWHITLLNQRGDQWSPLQSDWVCAPKVKREPASPAAGGDQWSPLQKRYSFRCFIRFHSRFFFADVGAKKKLSKRNALLETRKGGFLKKAPFKSPKNFRTLPPERQACAPKVKREPASPAAGGDHWSPACLVRCRGVAAVPPIGFY